MDIRQLRAFLKVCEYGSITQGAQYVFVSPQALSRTIVSLEQEVHMALFIRTPQGLILTDAGKLLRELAGPVVEAMDDVSRQMERLYQKNNQKMSIGITSGLEFFLRVKDLEGFKPRETDCSVRIQEYSKEECENMVSKGLMTAALVYGQPNVSGIRTALSFQRRRVCIIHKEHPLARKQTVGIGDLKGCRIVGSLDRGAQEQLFALCREQGIEPDFYPVEDAATMFSMCDEQGYVGIALDFSLIRSMVRAPNLIALPMDPQEFDYSVCLITGATENRRNAQAIVEFIREIIQQRNGQTPAYPFDFA